MNKLILLLPLVLLTLLFVFRRLSLTGVSPWPSEIILKVGSSDLRVTVVRTAQEKKQGLSGRGSLDDDEGMLFVFDEAGYPKFWMKGMKFSIDIIWIGSDRRIVDLTEGFSPRTFPQTFTPKVAAQYVLEVNEGWVQRRGLKIGDLVSFPPPS